MDQKFYVFWALGFSISFVSGCSTLPHREFVSPTYTTQINTSETYLAKIFNPLEQKNPNKTGYHILFDPTSALTSRLQLIERAEKTLDLQYYIWDNDKVGALALAGLLKAADRGVQVRLLLDDNNTKALEAAYYALDQHPNIQIRLFNPHKFRRLRALDFIFDFNRMTRRMHNKTFIADHKVALIGGRNMSNQYYNFGESYQFSDMDVILVGQSVNDINDSFDEYWNHEYAYPVDQLSAYKAKKLSYESVRQQLEDHWYLSNLEDYLNILTSSISFDQWFNDDLSLEWVDAKIVKDSAEKIREHADKEQHLAFQMKNLLGQPTQQVDLVSAYFVPQKENTQLISQLAEQGVKVRVLTNSYKANDVPIVHAFYSKYREDLLKTGVELYEFLPALPASLMQSNQQLVESKQNKQKNKKVGSSNSSLHAKFMALDHHQVFIGSFNFDPRSVYLNTEIGVILQSPQLATTIHNSMDEKLMQFSYRVSLDEHGKMIWTKKEGDKYVIYRQEPMMRWWHKLGLKLASWLPIEKQM